MKKPVGLHSMLVTYAPLDMAQAQGPSIATFAALGGTYSITRESRFVSNARLESITVTRAGRQRARTVPMERHTL